MPATRRENKPTLRDVADVANCSTAVVSTVINRARGNTLVSDAMRQRVLAAAKRLGYRPNFASRSLVRRSAETIGLYVPPAPWAGLGMPYEGAIIGGVEQACQEHGYDVLAINLASAGEPETCAHKFAEQRIDGLILLHVGDYAEWVEPLVKQAPNIVAVNYYGQAPVRCVNFDDRAAGDMAVRHLVELGHRRIAFVSSRATPLGPGAQCRCDGYRSAMASLGLPVDASWIWDRDNTELTLDPKLSAAPDDAFAAAQHLWELGEHRPTAVVAYNDPTAIHLMRSFQQLGATVPGDVSIVGMDGSNVGELVSPTLTSVQQPFAEMGRRAAKMLIRDAEARRAASPATKDEPAMEGLCSSPGIIVRESTAAPRGRS